MLRRSKTIVLRDDDTDTAAAPAPEPRPRLDRSGLELLRNEGAAAAGPAAPNEPQQRLNRLRTELGDNPISKGSPQSLEALRAEFHRTLSANTDDAPAAPRFNLGGGFKPLRLVLVLVALLAGGAAAFLALQSPELEPAPEPVTVETPAPPPAAQVLVATEAIPAGTRLTADLLQWQEWPETGLRPEFITDTASPQALEEMADSIARSPIVAGEPILRDKLGTAGDGYLSAMLAPGKRGVSVSIAPEAASGGFIVPNDHVDVVLTRQLPGGQMVSQTILYDVRVIALGPRLGPPEQTAELEGTQPGDAFANQAIATLELDSTQSELLVNATGGGGLSLVLRPLADSGNATGSERDAINQAIRMTSPFWQGSANGN